ncbi:MAG: PadR family transcriptional regulator [Bacillota bacterium]
MKKTPVDQQILIKGFLRLYLLHFLAGQEAYGAEIVQYITRTNRGHWKPSPGSLYPLLNRLEAEGLIAGEWDVGSTPPRKRYRLTADGKEELVRQREFMLPKMQSAIKMLQNHVKIIWGDDAKGGKGGPKVG